MVGTSPAPPLPPPAVNDDGDCRAPRLFQSFPSTDELGVRVNSGEVADVFFECPGLPIGDGT
jgi:hypothetical protein